MFTTKYIPALAIAITCGYISSSYAQETELQNYELTQDKFAELIKSTTNLSPDISARQAAMINKKEIPYSVFNIPEEKFYQILNELHPATIPQTTNFTKNFYLNFDDGSNYTTHIQALYQNFQLSFILTVFNTDEAKVHLHKTPQSQTLMHNIIQSPPLGQKIQNFEDNLKKLAGTIKCTWNQDNKETIINVTEFTIFGYRFTSSGNVTNDLFSIPIPFEGLVETDFRNRMDKLETTLEYFAFSIAKANSIRIEPKVLDQKATSIITESTDANAFFKPSMNDSNNINYYYLNKAEINDAEIAEDIKL